MTCSSHQLTLFDADSLATDSFDAKRWVSQAINAAIQKASSPATLEGHSPKSNFYSASPAYLGLSTAEAAISQLHTALKLQEQQCTTALDDQISQALVRLPRTAVELDRVAAETTGIVGLLQSVNTAANQVKNDEKITQSLRDWYAVRDKLLRCRRVLDDAVLLMARVESVERRLIQLDTPGSALPGHDDYAAIAADVSQMQVALAALRQVDSNYGVTVRAKVAAFEARLQESLEKECVDAVCRQDRLKAPKLFATLRKIGREQGSLDAYTDSIRRNWRSEFQREVMQILTVKKPTNSAENQLPTLLQRFYIDLGEKLKLQTSYYNDLFAECDHAGSASEASGTLTAKITASNTTSVAQRLITAQRSLLFSVLQGLTKDITGCLTQLNSVSVSSDDKVPSEILVDCLCICVEKLAVPLRSIAETSEDSRFLIQSDAVGASLMNENAFRICGFLRAAAVNATDSNELQQRQYQLLRILLAPYDSVRKMFITAEEQFVMKEAKRVNDPAELAIFLHAVDLSMSRCAVFDALPQGDSMHGIHSTTKGLCGVWTSLLHGLCQKLGSDSPVLEALRSSDSRVEMGRDIMSHSADISAAFRWYDQCADIGVMWSTFEENRQRAKDTIKCHYIKFLEHLNLIDSSSCPISDTNALSNTIEWLQPEDVQKFLLSGGVAVENIKKTCQEALLVTLTKPTSAKLSAFEAEIVTSCSRWGPSASTKDGSGAVNYVTPGAAVPSDSIRALGEGLLNCPMNLEMLGCSDLTVWLSCLVDAVLSQFSKSISGAMRAVMVSNTHALEICSDTVSADSLQKLNHQQCEQFLVDLDYMENVVSVVDDREANRAIFSKLRDTISGAVTTEK